MARAVIRLSGNITSYMPRMHKVIKGCAYNPISHVIGFRYCDMRVLIEKSTISIYGTENKNTVNRFMKWLVDKIDANQC